MNQKKNSPDSHPFLIVMNVRKGDNVKMISGKDRGKTGKVLFSFPEEEKVVVEGLNTVKRHLRAKKQGQKGQIINKERAVSISNIMLICSKCGKPTRVKCGIEGRNKVRICRKCGGEA